MDDKTTAGIIRRVSKGQGTDVEVLEIAAVLDKMTGGALSALSGFPGGAITARELFGYPIKVSVINLDEMLKKGQ